MAETPTYYAVLTDAGAALEARALAEGKGVILTHIAVGDANLQEITPEVTATALVHEVHRRPIDARSQDAADPKITLLHATIPADVGGWWIYEMGVIGHLEGESEEILYAYANHGRYYKMLPQAGQTITHELTIPIIQSTNAKVIINVADDGYATRQEYLALGGLVEGLRRIERRTWTLDAAVPQGEELPLPGLAYLPGRQAVHLSWDGLVCHLGEQFTEGPAGADGLSRSLRLFFAAPAGSEFEVFIRDPQAGLSVYGDANPAALADRLREVEADLDALADEVAYVPPQK